MPIQKSLGDRLIARLDRKASVYQRLKRQAAVQLSYEHVGDANARFVVDPENPLVERPVMQFDDSVGLQFHWPAISAKRWAVSSGQWAVGKEWWAVGGEQGAAELNADGNTHGPHSTARLPQARGIIGNLYSAAGALRAPSVKMRISAGQRFVCSI
ncbi:MAG: hypothetical protein ACLP9L_16985 [Thermoguttaceae bacterium]